MKVLGLEQVLCIFGGLGLGLDGPGLGLGLASVNLPWSRVLKGQVFIVLVLLS